MKTTDKNRRGFLGGVLAAGAAAVSAPLAKLHAAPAMRLAAQDDWLSEVQGTHRCLFDFPQHKNGFGLLHIHNYLATYEAAFGVGAADVGTVGTFYGLGEGCSLPMGFDDSIWAKYEIGEYLGLKDADGRPYTHNVFNKPTEADGHLFSQAIGGPEMAMFGGAIVASGIPNLQARGTKFIVCNNALGGWTFELEARGKGAQAEIDADLRAHLLPGVTIVPAMVIAIGQAQEAGISYNKQ
jgi:intracellular sulfur oxidation DsrE/DsrF family protein